MCGEMHSKKINKIAARMEYLYELNVPLRKRILSGPIDWQKLYIFYRSIRFEIEYFEQDRKLQLLCDNYEEQTC